MCFSFSITTSCNCPEECVEYDEETGECTMYECQPGCEECIEYECVERETVYIVDAKILDE